MSKSENAYKTIGEVVKILDLKSKKNTSNPTHTIRFWEKEFKQIKPKILNNKRRYYDNKNIKLLRKIKFLLKDQGMTINGVRKILNNKEPLKLDENQNASIKANNLKNKLVKISNLIIDPPGANEVLIKIRAAGLCHSDLSVIDGNRPRPLPMLLGHEASGEIIQLGKGVNRFEVGDHVVFAFLPSCGDCQFCKSGRAALCEPGAKANNEGTLIGGYRRIKLNS